MLYLEVLTFAPFTENLRGFTGVASVVGPPCPFLLRSSRHSGVVAAMNILKGYKKDDEECKTFTLLRFLRHTRMAAIFFSTSAGGNPFLRLEKSAVLQETRTFNDNVINSRKCATVLTKVLCILNQVKKRTGHPFDFY